uniref:Uncharacterized protein n=1 Tax=Chromera velia CCMP2878 TaxID=1169474 RepID=A0A0G4GCZ5_9ALVE|eukprot:Cvel_21324.t1-p1 / transcript=Cvel_21324.t1 / gene=Cvel_21324 / organism=Chromera_velia_CCMP2878 / gene_product=hypothetical protein / transcript_product=hypothetical protein / location=Cvel_scaffold1988:25951-26622(+) / protein_length=224 / sequence_SO=supercontig / SO=protein_coding / is_pseudo=false
MDISGCDDISHTGYYWDYLCGFPLRGSHQLPECVDIVCGFNDATMGFFGSQACSSVKLGYYGSIAVIVSTALAALMGLLGLAAQAYYVSSAKKEDLPEGLRKVIKMACALQMCAAGLVIEGCVVFYFAGLAMNAVVYQDNPILKVIFASSNVYDGHYYSYFLYCGGGLALLAAFLFSLVGLPGDEDEDDGVEDEIARLTAQARANQRQPNYGAAGERTDIHIYA